MRIVSVLVVALGLLLACSVEALAISSSKSSGKKVVTNQRKVGAGGFGIKKSLPVTHTPDGTASTQSLVQFLKSQQAKGLSDATEIGVSTITGLRGLYANKSFSKGEILCQIPSDCALALSDPALGGTDAPTVAHGGRNFLLMYSRNPQAQQLWAPYLNTLPTRDSQFDPTPDFYSPDEREQLEFPRAIQMAERRLQDIKEISQMENSLSMEDLQFATWLVSSRSFNIQVSVQDDNDVAPQDDKGRVVSKPQKTVRVLLPYLDMINHSSNQPNAELHLIDPEKDEAWFAIRANRPIPAGKEITIAYGSGVDSSVELLLNYGFVPSDNKMDAYMLKRGGEGSIDDLSGWTTTLDEDLVAIETAEGNMRQILALRIKLKQAYGDVSK